MYVEHPRSEVSVATILTNSSAQIVRVEQVLSEYRKAGIDSYSSSPQIVKGKQVRSEVRVGDADSYSVCVHT